VPSPKEIPPLRATPVDDSQGAYFPRVIEIVDEVLGRYSQVISNSSTSPTNPPAYGVDKMGVQFVMERVKLATPIAVNIDELDSLHRANILFWRKGPANTRKDRAEHHRRQARLDQIRAVGL
jgi:hypothetical protein